MDAATGEVNAVNSFQNCTLDWLPTQAVIFSHRRRKRKLRLDETVAGDATQQPASCYGQDECHPMGCDWDGRYALLTAAPEDGGVGKDGPP